MAEALLLGHALATFAMVGLIWFVQIVHYPLFRGVGEAGFAAYSADHSRLTTRVVGPPMLLELGTGVALVRWRPDGIPLGLPLVGLALLFLLWIATMFVSVPKHTILGRGFDEAAWRALCRGNWIRTAAWSARAGLVLWMLALVIR